MICLIIPDAVGLRFFLLAALVGCVKGHRALRASSACSHTPQLFAALQQTFIIHKPDRELADFFSISQRDSKFCLFGMSLLFTPSLKNFYHRCGQRSGHVGCALHRSCLNGIKSMQYRGAAVFCKARKFLEAIALDI